ncbi:leucine-rich_repeat domain-containing protein [Hexamita inflata]|uniref:Leucine-rich repeat domain-containing protein n=1 Tax=Hexamita inflata TaxID=28002 RepID=A0AA86PM68_9EUKA|nr:leucine-rich repeat domain-containing protein [Hexamita inflata]
MQSSSKLPNQEQKNTSDTKQSEASATLDSLFEYDKYMMQKYQSKIKDGTLAIQWDQDLKSLDFIRLLKINKLVFTHCNNIIPKLDCSTIKKLEIFCCEIQNVKDFQLENLEVLQIYNKLLDNNRLQESYTLVQEILQYKKLKEITLQKCITDFNPLSQMTGLTKLILIQCNLRCTDALRPLVNLEELCLNQNKVDITTLQFLTQLTILSLESCNLVDIDALRPLKKLKELYLDFNIVDITTLQYLTKLTILSLESCNLVNIEALRPLKKLKELVISQNSIVYLQPLLELRELSRLDASHNKIIDTESIQLHPNFNSFSLNGQYRPQEVLLKAANMMKDINNQISCLKQINKKSSRIKNENILFKQKITKQLQHSFYTYEQFVVRATILFQTINVFDGYQ